MGECESTLSGQIDQKSTVHVQSITITWLGVDIKTAWLGLEDKHV